MKKRFFITFFISVIVFSGIYAGLWRLFFSGNTIAVSEIDEDGNLITEKQDGNLRVENEILFLMMGIDGNDVTRSKGARTDTMMLFKLNFDTGKIDIISIPRDTRVLVRGKNDKINHAHAFGGSDLALQTVRDFLNIDLEYYVKVDYQVVKGVVDAIGGVEIDVPRRMRYSDPTSDPPLNINIQEGLQTLNGEQAHDFIRFRSYPDGDLGRVKAQQYFIQELAKQTLRPRNIIRIPQLVNQYYKNVETNVPLSLILKGASAANKIDMEAMESHTIPGEPTMISGISYYSYDKNETRNLVVDILGDYLLD